MKLYLVIESVDAVVAVDRWVASSDDIVWVGSKKNKLKAITITAGMRTD